MVETQQLDSPAGWRIAPSPAGSDVALTGDFDLVNRQDLQVVLARLVAQGSDVRVDMAGVTFADLGAVTTLVLAAQSMPPGRHLSLHRPPPMVATILGLCWPGLDRVELTL
ncbi:MAG TPA: STAS domain-containing protein [Actinomycetales bacterium]|nr:STAS domain-containing protein [Actinomycetales bacterium]